MRVNILACSTLLSICAVLTSCVAGRTSGAYEPRSEEAPTAEPELSEYSRLLLGVLAVQVDDVLWLEPQKGWCRFQTSWDVAYERHEFDRTRRHVPILALELARRGRVTFREAELAFSLVHHYRLARNGCPLYSNELAKRGERLVNLVKRRQDATISRRH